MTRYFARMGHQTLGSGGVTRYWHADLTGSTSLLTDASGAAGSPASKLAYSAFGELVGSAPSDFPRYQYDGAHGYENGLLSLAGASGTAPITLQHVGARWYQPGIGRFVQRDPIGLGGRRNSYVYTGARPVSRVDSNGLDWWTTYVFGTDPWDAFYPPSPSLGAGPAVSLQGGYVGIGVAKNPVVNASAGVGWTQGDGWFGYMCLGPLFLTYDENGLDYGGYISGSPGGNRGLGSIGLGNDDGGFGSIGVSIPVGGPFTVDAGRYIY